LRQSGIDFFRAQVVEGRIDQSPCGQREPISNQERIDCQVSCFIPDAGITLASTAVVAKGAVKDLMSQHSFKFSRLERFDEGWIVNDAPAIRRHRGYTARHELQPKTQSPEEWLV
jgi:hypothetical protein